MGKKGKGAASETMIAHADKASVVSKWRSQVIVFIVPAERGKRHANVEPGAADLQGNVTIW